MPLLIFEPECRFKFALCWILAALPLWVGAAPASQLKPPLELSFSPVSARAGEEVSIPIYLISDANLEKPFKILLPFLPAQLTFKELKTGLLARKAEWRLQPRVLQTASLTRWMRACRSTQKIMSDACSMVKCARRWISSDSVSE